MRRLLVIAHVLAFVGGYADAASYLLTRSFTGHLTGNTVLLCLHLARASWREALSNGLAIAAFVAGTVGAEWIALGSGVPAAARQLLVPLRWEAALLLVAAGCRWQAGPLANDLTVVFLCLGLGVQNGALRKCGSMSILTTFITGMSTSLVTATLKRAAGEEKPDDREKQPPAVLAGLLLTFAAGAVVGGWLDYRFKVWGFTGIFVPCAVALLAARHDWVPTARNHPPGRPSSASDARVRHAALDRGDGGRDIAGHLVLFPCLRIREAGIEDRDGPVAVLGFFARATDFLQFLLGLAHQRRGIIGFQGVLQVLPGQFLARLLVFGAGPQRAGAREDDGGDGNEEAGRGFHGDGGRWKRS